MTTDSETPKIRIGLYDTDSVGVIIKTASNCIYVNESDGDEHELEGCYLPINFDEDPDELTASLKYQLNQLFADSESFDFKAATAVNELLGNSMLTNGISVDFEKLAQSCPNWIYVTVKQTTFGPIQRIGSNADTNSQKLSEGFKGVMTWSNPL